MSSPETIASPVRAALADCGRHVWGAAGFSALGNLLYLAPSLFMLQVYDRVVPTGGLATLAALSLLTAVALVALGTFEWLRARLMIRASAQIEARLAERTLRLALSRPDLTRLQRAEIMRDFDTLRQGIASPGVIALFDAPWTPIYVIAAFLLHPALGVMTIVSGAVLVVLALRNEQATARPMKAASEAASIAYARQNHAAAHAADARALGLVTALAALHATDRDAANALQMRASFAGASHAQAIKVLRLSLQSGALALGAVLVIENAISAGAMIAASLLLARALAPIEQMVAAWRPIVQSRVAYARLTAVFETEAPSERTLLAAPTGAVAVERLTVLSPETERVALTDASFSVEAGTIVAIVGASGAGKSTLLRAMAGAAVAARGHIRFDGASRNDWDPERLARHVGYLPQDSILFPGTVRDNITRFRHVLGEEAATLDAAAIAAAQALGAHEMIVHLPQGYNTEIGVGGVGLSAGQTQRIALARALFDDPAVLLLDEPTAHLDADAQRAFTALLTRLRAQGVTVIFSSHHVETLAYADKLLVLAAGRVERFGAASEVRPATKPRLTPVSFSTGNFNR